MSVGLIIANFNKEKYISQCLDSVISQTLIPDEVWVIDDCSTDKSKDIIINYCNKYSFIHSVLLDKNGGVSKARNIGIRNCKCEYITTLDSDDFFFSNTKIENEMKALKRNENLGQNFFAYSKTVIVDVNGKKLKGFDYPNSKYIKGNIYYKMLAKFQFLPTSPRDICVKRQIAIDAGLYDESRNYLEDFDYLLRIGKKCKAVYIPSDGVAYRQVDNGLSKGSTYSFDKEMNEIIKKEVDKFNMFEFFIYHYYSIRYIIRRIIGKMHKIINSL